jgi:hypothetical protein
MQRALTDERFGLFKPDDVLVRENLSTERLRIEFLQFLKIAKPDDRLLLYFSGHGDRLPGERLALCGIDTQHNLLDATSFDTTSLREWIAQYNRSPSTIVVLDCCYAGQMKGGGPSTETIVNSLGSGTVVLASGGNEPARDASEEDTPSPFTEALAQILVDPAVAGDPEGSLTVEEVYRQITSEREPPLLPRPHWNVSAQGSLALARRAAAAAAGRPRLKGYRPPAQIEVVDLEFTDDMVTARWASQEPDTLDLTSLDDHRRTAVRRLTQLADAVIRVPEYGEDPNWQLAVHRAWDCIGTNLFETAVPPRLRDRIRAGSPGQHMLKVRLSFSRGNPLEAYPWEYLHLGPGPPLAPDAGVREAKPLALRSWMLIERVARIQPAGEHPREATPSAGIINSLHGSYSSAAAQVAEGLIRMDGLNVIMDRRNRDATWGGFLDSIDGMPRYLVLFAPVMRANGPKVGFYDEDMAMTDWRTAEELSGRLVDEGIVFDAIVIVTFAAKPGQDSYRATVELARSMAWAGLGPVVFVCHAPGYERNFPEGGRDTFPVLLLDALTQPEPLQLEQAFCYAKNRVVEREGDERRRSFGAPGYYVNETAEKKSPATARSPSTGDRLTAPAKGSSESEATG